MIGDPIQYFSEHDFRWGDCQAIKYDPANPIFEQPYLYHLWDRTRRSGRAKMGALPMLFCGMTNLSCDVISAYLTQRAVCVVGEWRVYTYLDAPEPDDVGKPYFHDLGFCFPAAITVTASTNDNPQNSCMAGYTFFQDAWKTPQQTICMFLGLAWLFHTFTLAAMHGQRYADNHLTARFTRKFGFKDVGTASHMLLREPGGVLLPMTLSTLLRSDFVALTRNVLSNAGEESNDGRGQGQ